MKKTFTLSTLGCRRDAQFGRLYGCRHALTVLLCAAFFLPPLNGSLYAQNYQWAKNIGSTGYNGGNCIAVDGSGNVYITGYFRDTADFDPSAVTANLIAVGLDDIYFAKYDANGNYLWAKSIGSTGYDVGNSIAVDNSGNVYITGYFSFTADFDPSAVTANLTAISSSYFDAFFAKYDSNGNYFWAKNIGSANYYVDVNSIAVDASGSVYITGYFADTADFDPGPGTANLFAVGGDDLYFAKYNGSGNYLWAKSIGSTNSDYGYSIAVVSGNVYITGYFGATADFDPSALTANLTAVGFDDVYFAKYDASGNYIWAKAIGGANSDKAYSIAADASGNVYTTGTFNGTADFDPGAGTVNLTALNFKDIFFAKYDASGNYLWAKSIGSTTDDFGQSLAVVSGYVYITGYFGITADFDPGAGINSITTVGGNDIFFAKYDASGNYLWAKSIGSASDDYGRSIATDTSGNVYVTGNFRGTADFDPDAGTANLTPVGSADIFFAKYSPPCLPTYTDTIAQILHDGINCIDYPIVKIGSQWWMAENVNATLYSDSTPLINGTGVGDITGNYTTKYYFNYDDNPANSDVYGKLYTWAAAMNGVASSDSIPSGVQGVCPTGWHLPGDAEWKQLEMGLGMTAGDADLIGWRGTDEGGKLKETGTSHWATPNTGATNTSGFTALPGGFRGTGGTFGNVGNYGIWWCSTEVSGTDARDRFLGYNTAQVYRDTSNKAYGYNCRCVKDILPPLTASISTVTNVTCNGGSDGTATVTATGGTPPYTYSWSTSPSQTGSVATGLTAGVYTVTVTDNVGGTATASATITEPAAITITLSTTDATCNGSCDGSATATITGGTSPFNFSWSNSATTNPVTGLCAGTYGLTVTDANGCTATASAIITEPAAMSMTLVAADVPCYGYCNGSITATVSNGTSPLTYLWGTGATGNPIAGLCAGTYQVTVTDANNCSATATAAITEPQAISIAISSTTVTCYGSCNASATATVSGGTSPYGYSWSNGSTVSAATGLCAGTYTVTVVDAAMCGGTTSTTTITEPPALTVAPSVTDVTCNGSCDGSASVSVSGGVSPYIYIWSNSATTNPVAGLCAGTYGLTVTDANGCTASSSAIITEPAALSVSVTSADATCNGCADGTAAVTGSGGTTPYSYLWSSGETNDSISGKVAGIYTVTVTDGNGCTATGSATITEPLPPCGLTVSISSTVNVSCFGASDGSLNTSVSNGATPVTYQWSNGDTTSYTTFLSTGTYTVTVTDSNNCTETAIGTITEPTVLLANMNPPVNASCFGGCDGSSSASPSGGVPPYTFLWSNAATDSAISGLCQGTNYNLTVTDARGCTSGSSSTINSPSALTLSFSTTDVTCYGGNDGAVSATAGGGMLSYYYLWSNGETQSAIINLVSGSYTITVTDTAGCTITDSITISEPAALNVTTSSTDATCNGCSDGTATVNVAGGTPSYSYLWNDSAQTNGRSFLQAGIYTVTVTDANGCTATGTATVSDPPPGNVVASVSIVNATCYGICNGSATASGTGGQLPYTYNWSNGMTAVSINGLCAGSYTLTVTDSIGNTDTAMVTLIDPPQLTVSVSVSNVSCYGGNDGSATASATGGSGSYSYVWNTGNSTSSINLLPSSIYSVTVTDANGCTATGGAAITEPPQLTVSASSTDATCNGCPDGTATANVNGGTTPYSYTWNTGITGTQSIASLQAGTYTVTVTDNNGCTGTATATVSDPPPYITVTINTTDVSCAGSCNGSATASITAGTPPFTYSWSTGGSSSSVTGLCAGNYSLTVFDSYGSGDTVSILISAPAALALTTNIVNVSCFGACNGSTTADATGGTPPYSYAWSAGGTGSTRSGLCSGSYAVTVNDSKGCNAISSFNITQPDQLVIVKQTTNLNCYGICTGTANATADGGVGPYTYLWSNGGTGSAISNLCATSYSITVTDAAACTKISSVTITQPTPIVITTTNVTNATCGNPDGTATISVSGGSPPYKYIWSNNDTLPFADGLPAGLNSVIVMDGAGCVQYGTVLINNTNAPNVDTSFVTHVTCSGATNGSIQVYIDGGTPPYTYLWSDGATTKDRTGLSGGTYNLEVEGSDGCVSAKSFIVNEPAVIQAAVSATDAGCLSSDGGATVTASGGTPPYSYAWNTGATTSSISNVSSGIYSVGVFDSEGCSKVFQIIIGNANGPVLSIMATSITCDNPTGGIINLTVTGGTSPYAFNWSSSDTTEDLSGLSAGTYSVTVTDASGCIGFANAEIKGELLGSEPICIVTVDSATGKNLILWDKTLVPGAKEFNIYKEGVTAGVYNKIATLQYSAVSEYVDQAANPQQRSFRYRISAVDSCGNESELSEIHKTMYLGVNIGLNNKINLLWDAYEGFPYGTFVVYRGTDTSNLQVMDSIPSNLNYWTDLTPPTNTMLYYVVAALKAQPCTSLVKIKTYNASKSNTASLQAPIGIEELWIEECQNCGLRIMPNPANDKLTIKFENTGREKYQVEIYNMIGRKLYSKPLDGMNKFEINVSAWSEGIYHVMVANETEVHVSKILINR